MPTYHEIMSADLSTLTTAADRWDGMAKKFAEQEKAYRRDIHGISMGPMWSGLSAQAANGRFDVTLKEFRNAQVEAKAVASLLRDAHTQFTELRKKLQMKKTDAIKAGMAVSDSGVVSYDTAQLGDGERAALRHDPDYQQSVHTAVAAWQADIDRLVKAVGDADRGVDIALAAVVIDSNVNDGTLNGFNGQAQGDIEKYAAAAAAEKGDTKTDGWKSEGETSVSGLDADASATGPDTSTGKLGEAEAHADLGRASAEGSLTNDPMRLSGSAEAYAGAKASVAGGITQEGITGEASGFAGGEAAAQGRADAGPVGVYGRAEAKVGPELGANAGVGPEGVNLGATAFAGVRGGVGGGVDIGGIGIGANAEAWAGPGAEASLDIGKNSAGAWHLKAKAGASPILGGELGFEFTVDPGKVADTAGDLVDAIGSVF
jgi:hypothetical protein